MAREGVMDILRDLVMKYPLFQAIHKSVCFFSPLMHLYPRKERMSGCKFPRKTGIFVIFLQQSQGKIECKNDERNSQGSYGGGKSTVL